MHRRVQFLLAAMAVAVVTTVVSVAPASAAPAASTPISNRVAWARTNGDILAITKVQGAAADLIAIGGNFTAVVTPDGVSHAAKNFAVLEEFTGALVYAGNADSYVRAISSWNGTIYLGGNFANFGGVARSRLAALSPSYAVTPWNPGAASTVRAVLGSAAGVYFAGEGTSVKLVNPTTGATITSQPVGGGAVRSLLLSPDSSWLYVGGLFETFGGLPRHGLIRANSLSLSPDSGFNAGLRPDSGVGADGDYDGQAGSSLAFDAARNRLVVGIAGYGSDETRVFNATTGALAWGVFQPGDGQGVGVVGSTYIVGYHRHDLTNPWPYFAAQLEATNGSLTNWDPGLTGFQSNEDGGNNGVQAIYVDQANRKIFLAGAFTTPVKSLALYTWGDPVTPPPNQPPTASFTSSVSSMTASFDGSLSSDKDGTIASYAWNFGDGGTASGGTARHTYASAGTYTVTLKVTDNRGASSTTSKSVTVPSPVTPPPGDQPPIGQLLITNVDKRSYSILGYAIDPDTDDPIQVLVDIHGVGQTLLTADYTLPGLPQSHPGFGPNHGFLFNAQLPPGTRDVCVYAIGADGGQNSVIGCNRVTVK